MLRRHVVTAIALLAFSGGLSQLEAQRGISVGPQAGYNFDAEEIFLGAEAQIPLTGVMVGENMVLLVPAFQFYPFIGGESVGEVSVDASLWGFTVDAMLPFDMGGNASPFVKAGIGFLRASASSTVSGVTVSDSDSDAFLNIAGGSTFGPPDASKFYGQVGVLIGSASSVYLQAGYLFLIG